MRPPSKIVEEGHFLRISDRCLTRTRDRGCNPGLITTGEGVVLVDLPQRPSDATRWLVSAREYGPTRILINTEHHLDHCACNGLVDVPIIAQQGTLSRFFDASPVWGTSAHNVVETFRRIDPEYDGNLENYRITPPQITFDEEVSLHFGNVVVRAVNLPGHLPNSTVVHVPADGVVYMSDLLFRDEIPWLHEADPRQWIESLDVVKSWNPEVVVPGHGSVSGIDELDVMRQYLADFVGAVSDSISRGVSLEGALADIDFLPRVKVPEHLKNLAVRIQAAGIERTYLILTGAVK